MKRATGWISVAYLLLAMPAAMVVAQESVKRDLAMIMNEQQMLTPGYPIGNIAIGDPAIADYKVMPGRRDLLLLGRGIGQTTLMVWDQKGVRRHEIMVNVNTREGIATEVELRGLLKDFPSVTLTKLAGSLVVSGAVSSRDDLAAIERIAAAASVKSVVRYVAPETAVVPGSNMPTPSGRGSADSGKMPTPGTTLRVHYEIEVLEASARFRSGSYATGIEPSGRSLFKGTIETELNQEGEIFIGGVAMNPKSAAKNTRADARTAEQSGIRLKLRPTLPDETGRFKSFILVETNLPIGSSTYDPATWRRARWEFSAVSGEPFGITGGDLMATPDIANSGSTLGAASSTASTVARVPGVSNAPGVQYVPVLGSLFGSNAYKAKTTQMLVVLRPRIVPPGL